MLATERHLIVAPLMCLLTSLSCCSQTAKSGKWNYCTIFLTSKRLFEKPPQTKTVVKLQRRSKRVMIRWAWWNLRINLISKHRKYDLIWPILFGQNAAYRNTEIICRAKWKRKIQKYKNTEQSVLLLGDNWQIQGSREDGWTLQTLSSAHQITKHSLKNLTQDIFEESTHNQISLQLKANKHF